MRKAKDGLVWLLLVTIVVCIIAISVTTISFIWDKPMTLQNKWLLLKQSAKYFVVIVTSLLIIVRLEK